MKFSTEPRLTRKFAVKRPIQTHNFSKKNTRTVFSIAERFLLNCRWLSRAWTDEVSAKQMQWNHVPTVPNLEQLTSCRLLPASQQHWGRWWRKRASPVAPTHRRSQGRWFPNYPFLSEPSSLFVLARCVALVRHDPRLHIPTKTQNTLQNFTSTNFQEVTYISILRRILRAINANRNTVVLGALGFVQFTVIVEVSLVSDHHLSIK